MELKHGETDRKRETATRSVLGCTAIVAVLLLAGGIFATPVAAASSQSALHHVVPRTLTSPNAGPAGGFGIYSAASGDTVVVGAWNETVGGYVGAGHVYVYDSKTGALLYALTSPNAQTNGEFGEAVGISGNMVVVTAWNEAVNGYAGAGRVYLYDAATGALLRTFSSPNAQTNGGFGTEASVSGNILVVGAWGETADGDASAGHAYVFNVFTGALVSTLTSPNAQAGGMFGETVEAGPDRAYVGANMESADGYAHAGHAYVFNALTGALIHAFTSPSPQTGGDFGGYDIGFALGGSVLVISAQTETAGGYVGAGHVYLYNAYTFALLKTLSSPNPQVYGYFGWATAASGDTLVVGAWQESADGYAGAGNVYVFNAATGGLISTLTSPTPQTGGNFGESVALGSNTVVVGAWAETSNGYAGAGNEYIYYAGHPVFP